MRIFFSGIGGVGIGPLALIARDMGYEVMGSDANSSRYTDLMASQNIDVLTPQSAQNVEQAHQKQRLDWFVYTAALPEDHPELKAAKKLGIKTSKRDEFLNELIESKNLKLIAASGTHGKTTTTGMLIWLMRELGQPISYSIGTNISFGPSGQYSEGSQYFIYEADEYDRNMLKFNPFISVISSVDYDHPDTYPTEEDYLNAFRQFISQSHCTFMWKEDVEKIGGLPVGVVHSYGADEDLGAISLAGHNRKNAFLAIKAIQSVSPDTGYDQLAEIIGRFPGTERRFEKLADGLYSDYAHHPVEIASTLDMAQELNKNLVVVYQPHQNLRQLEIYKTGAYKNIFNKAAKVYWLPTYLSREPNGRKILTPAKLIKSGQINNAEPAEMNQELKQAIKHHLSNGQLVIIMGAGDIDAWARENLI